MSEGPDRFTNVTFYHYAPKVLRQAVMLLAERLGPPDEYYYWALEEAERQMYPGRKKVCKECRYYVCDRRYKSNCKIQGKEANEECPPKCRDFRWQILLNDGSKRLPNGPFMGGFQGGD